MKREHKNLVKDILKKLAASSFFQIEVSEDIVYEGKTYNNIKQRNNDSFVTLKNWEQNKESFFRQRMLSYPESYTLKEKIEEEFLYIEKLPINNDHRVLIKRYKAYLKQKQAPQPKEKSQTLTIDEIALLHAYSEKPITEENANEIVRKYGHTSSLRLLNQYKYFSTPMNRKGVPASPTRTKIRNKIKKIEKVIELLPKDKRAKALDEVEILKITLREETF